MTPHEHNVGLAGWSIATGLPLMPAVMPREPRAERQSAREVLRRWSVTRRARTRTRT